MEYYIYVWCHACASEDCMPCMNYEEYGPYETQEKAEIEGDAIVADCPFFAYNIEPREA